MPTDYEQVSEAIKNLADIDGELLAKTKVTSEKYETFTAEFWRVGKRGVILCKYSDNDTALYKLVGKNDDAVQKDIAWLNSIPLDGENA